MAIYPWDTAASLFVGDQERSFGNVEKCVRAWRDRLETEEQTIAIIRAGKSIPDRTGGRTNVLQS